MIYDDIMWIFVAISLTGNILIIKKNSYGFVMWTVSNIAWVYYDFYKEAYSQSFLFVIYTILALYGIYEWKIKK